MSADDYVSGQIVPADEVAEVVPVDPPEPVRADPVQTIYATALGSQVADRRPIVPAYLRSRDDARAVAGWLARYGAHVTGYHATRAPLYMLRLAWRSPRGAFVALAALVRWVFDAEGASLRRDAVHRVAGDEYLKLSKQRNERVKRRGLVVLVAAGVPVVAVLGALAWRWASTPDGVTPAPLVPSWAFWGGVLLTVTVLGVVGTPSDKRVTDVVVVSASAPPRLSAEVVTRALSALGIAAMTAKGATIGFPAPITRDGPGWRADVDLPYGVTVADVVERRDKLASGLRRPLGCVWPESAAEAHAGRLVLWVGDQDMATAKPRPWALAKGGRADLFAAVPFGADQRGRPVSISLMFANVLIGAMPRFGKTFALRVLILAAALDPTAQLRIFELKGTGDLSAVEGCCHHYASGADDATLEAAMASLREVYAELNTRAATIRRLPRVVCPENKVTPELSARRDLGLFPLVVAIDECQELFSHPDFRDEADRLATAIIKRGPALGIILILATQRPDAKSLPTGVSANVGIRFCLRVMGQTENDMVLGTSSYKNGLRATTFGPRDKGIGYLVGAGDDPQIVRSAYIDAPGAEVIATRARAAREAAGTLSGHALGEAPPVTPGASLLDDLTVVFGHITVDKVWSETVVEHLAEMRPELYAGWTPDALAAAVKPLGITTGQVWGTDAGGTGRNRRGLSREAVTAAVDARGAARREIGS